jgi:hypothetical protein
MARHQIASISEFESSKLANDNAKHENRDLMKGVTGNFYPGIINVLRSCVMTQVDEVNAFLIVTNFICLQIQPFGCYTPINRVELRAHWYGNDVTVRLGDSKFL